MDSSSYMLDGSIFILGVLGLFVDDGNNGWMTCNFRSFSSMFQSYQENERLHHQGFALSGIESWTARSVGQHLTHWAAGAPIFDGKSC